MSGQAEAVVAFREWLVQIDTIKAIFTYATALVIVGGGFLFLYATRLDPAASVQGLQTVVAGFMGAALAFLFQREAAAQSAYAQAAATNAAKNGNGLVSGEH